METPVCHDGKQKEQKQLESMTAGQRDERSPKLVMGFSRGCRIFSSLGDTDWALRVQTWASPVISDPQSTSAGLALSTDHLASLSPGTDGSALEETTWLDL